jgi:GxxExxY protein
MPIFTAVPIIVFDQPAFHAVDEVVTGMAFDLHNEFGRYLEEHLYKTEMTNRLTARGYQVVREMKITLTLDDFQKDYYADLLINGGVLVETKVVDALVPAHTGQTLGYLFMCGLNHGILLNFRTARVQHEFVSTKLTHEDRRRISWEFSNWKPLSQNCRLVKTTLERALLDWGACLDPNLYRDVITHFLGGAESMVRVVELASEFGVIGTQKVHHVDTGIALSVTASVHQPKMVLEHHKRFLRHTTLRAIQWINLDRGNVTFRTIERDNT